MTIEIRDVWVECPIHKIPLVWIPKPISIILAKHSKTCRNLYENPAAREIQVIREQLKPQ